MASVNFYLANNNQRGDKLIMLFFSYDGNRLRYSTGETINEKDWNKDSQKVKRTYPGSIELNGLLKRIDEEVSKIYREAKTYGKSLTNEYFKEKLDQVVYPTGKKSKDLFNYFEEYIQAQSIVNTLGTVKKYKTVLNHLKQFQIKKHYSITFDKIDARFNELLRAFYINDCK